MNRGSTAAATCACGGVCGGAVALAGNHPVAPAAVAGIAAAAAVLLIVTRATEQLLHAAPGLHARNRPITPPTDTMRRRPPTLVGDIRTQVYNDVAHSATPEELDALDAAWRPAAEDPPTAVLPVVDDDTHVMAVVDDVPAPEDHPWPPTNWFDRPLYASPQAATG